MLKRSVSLAVRANVTGLSSMVAYSGLMSLVPVTLLTLFAVSVATESASARSTLVADLERIFPAATQGTLTGALDSLQGSRTPLAVGAALTSAWAGIALWSAIDTSFREIYGYEPRGWVEQKRWAARMLVLGIGLVLAFLAVPAVQTLGLTQTGRLPFGVGSAGALSAAIGFVVSHLLLFAALCGVYAFVPRGRPRWRGVWPGAAVGVALMTTVSLVFPVYLSRVSTLAHAGAAFSFVVIVLAWFYLMALALLLGAAVNAARSELAQG